MLYDRAGKSSAFGKVGKGFPSYVGIKQALSEEFCRRKIHFINSLARYPLFLKATILGNLDSRSLRQEFKRGWIIEIFGLHYKGYNIAARTATEALKILA